MLITLIPLITYAVLISQKYEILKKRKRYRYVIKNNFFNVVPWGWCLFFEWHLTTPWLSNSGLWYQYYTTIFWLTRDTESHHVCQKLFYTEIRWGYNSFPVYIQHLPIHHQLCRGTKHEGKGLFLDIILYSTIVLPFLLFNLYSTRIGGTQDLQLKEFH